MTAAYGLIAGALVVLFALERWRPLRQPKRSLWPRVRVNAVMSALAVATALIAVRPAAIAVLEWTDARDVGIVNAAAMPYVVQAAVCFLLLDVTFYYWHRANHAWPVLWRFHNAHHIDPDLDVTTALRFHAVEIAFSAAFRALQVLVIGGPAQVIVAYELCFQLNTLFQHSNVRLPIRVERWLNLVIVTPRMHGIHHSKRFHETNANWSTVLTLWDRLHGTLRLNVAQKDIDIGIAGYSTARDNAIGAVLAMPFRKQRDYWQDADRRDGRNGDRLRLAE
jgi:sterol desaturase/sphingolipid hydroxylase (fatty acid hydroxylase superfamily)